jgi:asparagine synthase (glutamine-hydrolysing)
MCGISGIYGQPLKDNSRSCIQKMNDSISHRGPDDEGIYIDTLVALGHRRLAILDLSPAGHQPMFDVYDKLVIIFNGEIYNFQEIKKELTDYPFKTHSDTEVILAAYLKWGKECVHKFNGMFAIAIWDKQTEELFIVRDRLGVKPIYYTEVDGQFYFASEIRALLNSDAIKRKINKAALPEFFSYQTVHAPNTLVENVFMLMPGHSISLHKGKKVIAKWWSLQDNYSKESHGKAYSDVCSDINTLLMKSVERRLISDVPFGAFLSGGIDSSAIVGMMSKVQKQKVKTFTIVFDEEAFSEAKYARLIAERFNTDHHEFRLNPKDFLNELPRALKAIDHPSGDGPNSYIVSRITREAGITMALSGLGGDELFAGYPVFNRTLQIENIKWLYSIPKPLRQLFGKFYTSLKGDITSHKMMQLLQLDDSTIQNSFPLSRQVGLPNYVKNLLGLGVLPQDQIQRVLAHEIYYNGEQLPLLSKVSVAEMTTYMQNVLLRDTDQMSMAVALEVRVPFLDYKLVEYVLGVKDEYKIPSIPKKLLVDSLQGLLPDEIIHRKKMGFVFPWAVWLKNELRPLCDSSIQSIAKRDIVNGAYLLDTWNRFLIGDQQVRWLDIWLCTMLESWIQQNNIEA